MRQGGATAGAYQQKENESYVYQQSEQKMERGENRRSEQLQNNSHRKYSNQLQQQQL